MCVCFQVWHKGLGVCLLKAELCSLTLAMCLAPSTQEMGLLSQEKQLQPQADHDSLPKDP